MAYVGYEGYDTVVEDNQIYLKAKAEYDANVEQYEKDTKARDKQIKQKAKAEAELQQAKIEETQKYEETFANETKIYEKKVDEEQKAFKQKVSNFIDDSKKQYEEDVKEYEAQSELYEAQQDKINVYTSTPSGGDWGEFIEGKESVDRGGNRGRRPSNRKDATRRAIDEHFEAGTLPPALIGTQRGNNDRTNWVYTQMKQEYHAREKAKGAQANLKIAQDKYGFKMTPVPPNAGRDVFNKINNPTLYGGSRDSGGHTMPNVVLGFANKDLRAGNISIISYQEKVGQVNKLKREQERIASEARSRAFQVESRNQLNADRRHWETVSKGFADSKALADKSAKSVYNPVTEKNILGDVKVAKPTAPEFPSYYNTNPMLNKPAGVVTSGQIDGSTYILKAQKGQEKVRAQNAKQKIYTKELRAGNVGLATALLQPQTTQKYFGKDTRNLKTYLTSMGYDINNPDSIPDSVLMNPTKYTEARAGKQKYDPKLGTDAFFAPKAPVLSTEVSEKRATARAKWESIVVPNAPINPVMDAPKAKIKENKPVKTGTSSESLKVPSWTFNGETFTDKSKLDAYVATRKQEAQKNSDIRKLNYIPNKTGKLNPSGYIDPIKYGESYNSNPVLTKPIKSATPTIAPLKTDSTNIPSGYSGDIFSVTNPLTGVTKQFRKESRAQEHVAFVNKEIEKDWDKKNPLPPKPQWVIMSDEKINIPKMGGGTTELTAEKENVFDSLAEAEAFDKAQKQSKALGDYDNYSLANYAHSVRSGVLPEPTTWQGQTALKFSQAVEPFSNTGKSANNMVGGEHMAYTETAEEMLFTGTIDDIMAGTPQNLTGVRNAYTEIAQDPSRFVTQLPATVATYLTAGKAIKGGIRGLGIIQTGIKEVLPKTHPIIRVGSKMESGYNTGVRVVGKPVRALQVVNQKILGKVNDYATIPISQTVEKTSTGQMVRVPVFSSTQKVLDKSIKFTKNINNKFTMIDDTRVGLKLKAELKLTPSGRQTRKHTLDEANKMMNESEEGYKIMQPVKKYELNYYDKTTSSIYTPLHPEMSGKLLQMKGGFGNVKIDKVKVTEFGKKQDAKIAQQARDDVITGKYSDSRQGRMNYYQNPRPKIEAPKPKSALSKWIDSRATRLPTKDSVEKKLGISWIKKTNKKIENKQFAKEHMFVDVVEVNLSKAQYITIRGILPKGLTKTTTEKSTQGLNTLTTIPLNKANKKIIEKAVTDEKLTLVGQKTTTSFKENSDHWGKLADAQMPLKKSEFNFKQGQTILAESKVVKDVKPTKKSDAKTFDPSDLKSSTEEFGRWNRINSGGLEGESKLPIKLPKGGGKTLSAKAEDDTVKNFGKGKSGVSELINKKEIPKPDKTTGKGGKGFIEGEGKSIAKSNWKNPYKQYSLGGIVTGEVIIPLHKNAPRIGEGSKLDTGLGTETGIQGRIDTGADIKSDTASMLKNETESLIKQDTPQKYRTSADSGFKLDSSMSLMTAQAPVPIMIKPQITLSKTKRPAGVVIPWGQNQTQTQRKPRKRGKKAGFIGNVRADSIVGVYKRADITYGKKRVSKLERQDKSLSKKSKTRIDGDMTLFKTKRKKTKKTESLLGHTFKKSKDEFALGKQKGSKGKRVKASLF